MIKKKISMLMTALLMLTMTACGGAGSGESETNTGISGDNSTTIENTALVDLSEETTLTGFDDDEHGSEDDVVDNDYSEDDSTAEYDDTAQLIWEKTQELFTALKEGDVDTLIALGDPNSEEVKALESHRDSEDLSMIIKIMFQDLVWMKPDEEDLDYLESNLSDAYESGAAGDRFSYSLVYAAKNVLYFNEFFVLTRQQGDVIPAEYRPETADEAWTVLEETMNLIPMVTLSEVYLTLPDENGDFYFLYDRCNFIDVAKWDEFEDCDDETLVQDYVQELCDIISDITVQDTETPYEEDDDIKREFTEYIVNKDFEAANTYAEEHFGTDYSSYGVYEALTDAQKEFVDQYVEDHMTVFWSDASWEQGGGKRVRGGAIMVYGDKLDYHDEDVNAWYQENNIQTCESTFYYSSSNTDNLAYLLYVYKFAIRYAVNTLDK